MLSDSAAIKIMKDGSAYRKLAFASRISALVASATHAVDAGVRETKGT